MHREFPWPDSVARDLGQIEQLEITDLGEWLRREQLRGRNDSAIHLVMALASARYVDHHGPFIGHGTFNGGPMLRAASILTRPFRNLALLQTAAYVVDLLHQPNYGPYLLMDMEPITEATRAASRDQLRMSIESGEQPLLAEHRLVGLLKTDSRPHVRRLLTEVALRQFHENEHRLLIVHRAAQLMDDTNGWTWAEPLFRAAVQYLASRPDVRPSEMAKRDLVPLDMAESSCQIVRIESAVDALIHANYGDEPHLLRAMVGLPRVEVIALTGAEMLRRSRFDAHAVTGIHCAVDLLHDPTIEPHTQTLAMEAALLGQRTRRQKEQRSTWRSAQRPRPKGRSLDELQDIVVHDGSGLAAMDAVAGMLLAGAEATDITRTLMEVALTHAGPFEAIHNVKMLLGQLLETQRSRYPELAWRHLAAGARVVAEVAAQDCAGADPILSLWHNSHLSVPDEPSR
ncbi:MAG: hypothetical protein C7B44_13720 [Sulfobacillus thermosulfidooxidans]|nr:MAG: hypothetical protein C7B44_13720 [Sulfobacillus thermosulfidooxidans]